MGEYANIKRRDIIRLLKKLEISNKDLEILRGGKHNIKVKYIHWEQSYPVPIKHGEVNKHIVKALMKRLVKSDICTKEEFDSLL